MNTLRHQVATTDPGEKSWMPKSVPDALVSAGVSRLVIILALTLTGLAMLSMSPGIGFDAAPGLLASEQRLMGRGNRLTEMLVADPGDLRRDVAEPIAWWPPGHQVVVYGLRTSGLTLAQTINAIAIAAWAVGLAAWVTYHRLTLVNRWVLPWTVTVVALLRLTHQGGFEYTGGESLLWGLFPLAVLAHLFAWDRPAAMSLVCASLAGFLATTLVVFKYSGAFLAVGFGLAWFWGVWREKAGWLRSLAWLAGAAVGAGLVVLSAVPQLMHGINPLTSPRSHDVFSVIAWGVFGPFDAMSDLTEAAASVSKRMGGGPLAERTTGILALALGLLVLLWFITVRKSGLREPADGSIRRRQALRLAACVTTITCLALTALRLADGDVSWEARHHQYGMYLLLPFFAEWLAASYWRPGLALRGLTLACVAIFFVLPVTYGGLVLTRRVVQGPTGVSREWSRAGAGVSPALPDFARAPGFDRALVATIIPRTALTFADHRVLFLMTLDSGELAAAPDASWRSQRFAGRPEGGVALVLPPGVTNADRDTLMRSFIDVGDWTQVPLGAAPAAELWVSQAR